jgi:hypothetical protein
MSAGSGHRAIGGVHVREKLGGVRIGIGCVTVGLIASLADAALYVEYRSGVAWRGEKRLHRGQNPSVTVDCINSP